MEETLPFLFPDTFVERHNTAWRVEPGIPDPEGAVLAPSAPWESGACNTHGTTIVDPVDGRWKMWYLANEAMAYEYRLCYAESADGVHWTRPDLDICPYDEDHPRTNVLIDHNWGGNCHDASVLVNPEAPEDRRYEMFILLSRIRGRTFVLKGIPLPPGRQEHSFGVYRFVSSDGLRWRPGEATDVFPTEDSVYIFRERDGSYVAYHKTEPPSFPGGLIPFDIGRGGCRVVARRTSPDGILWSEAQIVLAPDWRDPQDTQFMELHPHRVPGGLVAIVPVYHPLTATLDLQFAASREGIHWWRPDRRPCVGLRPVGDEACGQLWPTHHLVEHGGRVYLYFGGIESLHHDMFSTVPREQARAAGLPYREWKLRGESYNPHPGDLPDHGAIYRVSWPVGRYWAMAPAAGGSSEAVCTTVPLEFAGKGLRVNAVTVGNGEVAAELLDGEGQPLPGYGRAECVTFRGDDSHAPIRWAGGDTAPVGYAAIRFCLRRARLYGFGLV